EDFRQFAGQRADFLGVEDLRHEDPPFAVELVQLILCQRHGRLSCLTPLSCIGPIIADPARACEAATGWRCTGRIARLATIPPAARPPCSNSSHWPSPSPRTPSRWRATLRWASTPPRRSGRRATAFSGD